jgi:diguanylate cyclase (GGDEF)-like protein
MASTGMIIDGVLGSQCVDSSGEVLDVEGADIIDLEEGRGVLNYEHQGSDEKTEDGKHKNQGQEIVGKIVSAKKIMKESDASTSRERLFWKKVKHPFIYGVCRLYDGAGHEGAKALAAQIRDHHANDEPILVRFSVEGSTLKKEGNVLKASVIRRVALTLKPCNRTADSGLLEDPNAPSGWDKKPTRAQDILEGLGKQEHPLYRKLGGEYVTEYVPIDEVDHTELVKSIIKLKVIRKALTAGVGGAAPSQLSGGAALVREDLIKFKSKAMKTLKSFLDKNDDFSRDQARAAFKAELPEASDDFIDHFADIAEDYRVKLRKDISHGLEDDYPKLNSSIGAGIAGPGTRVDRSAEEPGAVAPKVKGSLEMKPGGKMLIQRPGAGKGSSRVALQQHFPDDEHYHTLLKPDLALAAGKIDPETYQNIVKTVHEPWHRAMSNWLPLNRALSQGKVPRGVMAKAVIFAAMSPNTGVPLQERYYGHYMDMMHQGKVDPFKPISEDAVKEFTERSTNGSNPEWNRDYYASHPLKMGSNGQPDDEGHDNEVGDLPQIQGLRNAHKLWPYLEHLTAKHRDDTQGIAAELMDMKAEHNRHVSNTHRMGKLGREPTTQAPDHVRTLGYGPKLTRYLLGMMGGGNMIVPDRHMVRSMFDLELEPDPQRPGKFKGSPMLEKLQTGVVTKAQNEPLLRAIDHNFFVKHPAVKHVLETFPKHFAGREQQAIFPAFWLHWLTIGHHDQMRGRPFMGFNADTDHGVFWDSVKDEMIKHGLHPHPLHDKRPQLLPEDESFDFGANLSKNLDPWPRDPAHLDHPVWLKAAGVVQALRQRWGETPALLAYFSHVLPHVMAAETPVPPVTHVPHSAYMPNLAKAEGLLIDLRKALAAGGEAEHPAFDAVAPHIQHVYRFIPGPDLKIRRHAAGRFMTAGQHLNILEDYHGHLRGTLSEGPLDHWKQQQIANLKINHKYEVVPLPEIRAGRRPELWESPQVQPAPAPIRSFEYIRHGQDKADHLEYVGGRPHLNGHPLDHEQTQALLQHIRNGHALIRYKQDRGVAVQKMETWLENLMKSDDPEVAHQVHSALGKLDELVRSGHLDPQHAEALRNHAFKDPMTGHTMGNKFAYTDFLNRVDAKGGVHVALDGNDFKSVNDKFGHEAGDRAIKALGQALRGSMEEVAPGQGKLFRTGGDEFAAHLPTHEHAAAFGRALRNRLEAMTPIEGQHRLSMSMGFGTSPQHADTALYHAKAQKLDPLTGASKYSSGTAPNMAHSLVPGFEGPVPLDQSQLHIKPPPAPAPVEKPVEPVVHSPPSPTPGTSSPALATKPT